MKRIKLYVLLVFAMMTSTQLLKAQSVETTFPLTMEQKAPMNVGTCYLGVMKAGEGTSMVCNFLFEKGSHNAWHTHPVQQCTIVLSGEGYYQEEGQPKRLLHKGEWVVTPANVAHWNGSTPDSVCECITVTDYAEDHVHNLRKVTDEEFCSPVDEIKK